MNDLEKLLLKACKDQHQALDLCMARLIMLDKTFMPSKSGIIWDAVKKGQSAIKMAEVTPPVGRGLPFKLLGIKVERFTVSMSVIGLGINLRENGFEPKVTEEQLTTPAWRYQATNRLGWWMVQYLARHDKVQRPNKLCKECRKYEVVPLPDLSERMADALRET
jgi:hypothetical protein